MWLSDISVRRPWWRWSSAPCSPCSAWWPFQADGAEMPDVQTPSVSITTTYEGRPRGDGEPGPKPIEDQLSGISGIRNINSVTRRGAPPITVEFKLSWNMLEGTLGRA